MALWSWSRTAASNASADSSVNWAEGQPPSSVNDSARAMMARIAEYRDDISGAIVTGGAVNAYTVSSFQGFDSLAHLGGNAIAFSPHITSTGAVQINVDGNGLKPLRPSPGVDFIGGELIQGTPYVALYNNAAGEAYVRGYVSSPFNLPFLGGCDFWDTIAPNSAFIFPAGQAISRTVYARAFARWGTTFGAGDGSTTFNVPDKTGRVSAMKESVATRLTTAGGGVDGATMGSAAGGQNQTLTLAQLPTGITVTGTVSVSSSPTTFFHGGSVVSTTTGTSGVNFDAVGAGTGSLPFVTSSGANTLTSNNTNGNAHPIVQPTIVCNYIIRII